MASDRHDTRPGRCQVNRSLLPVKGFFLVFFAATGCLLPFIAVYMKHLGLSSSETGIIYGVTPFLSFLVRPIAGAVADRWLKHKLVLIACTLLTAVLHFLIMFVPARTVSSLPTVHVKPVMLHCRPEGSVLMSCLRSRLDGTVDTVFESESRNVDDDDDPGCSIPLDKFAESFSRSVNGEMGHNSNVTKTMGSMKNKNNTSSKEAQSGICSLTCRLVNNNSNNNNNNNSPTNNTRTSVQQNSAKFCFTNHRGENHTTRCQQVQSNNQSLTFEITSLHSNIQSPTFNITSLQRPFSTMEPAAEEASSSDVDVQDCNRTYPVSDIIHPQGQRYTTLACPESSGSTMMMCSMRCSGVVSVVSVCDNSRAGAVETGDGVHLDATFGLLMGVFFLASATFSPVFSLIDAVAFDQLGEQRHKYGQQRMWGTLGHAVLAITTTFTMNPSSSSSSTVNYDIMFYLFTGLCLVSALIALPLRISSHVRCPRLLASACRLLALPQVAAFLGVVLYFGMVSGAIEGFLFWFLADLGARPLLFGLCLVATSAFEIPLFFFSGALLKRIRPVICLYCSMLALSVRLLSYSLLNDPWHVLLVEPLHGVTFALMWAAVANHADLIAPLGMSASVQGLVGGMNFGVGKGLGGILTGVLFSAVGERWTFRILALGCLLLMLVYLTLNAFVFSPPPSPRTTEAAAAAAAATSSGHKTTPSLAEGLWEIEVAEEEEKEEEETDGEGYDEKAGCLHYKAEHVISKSQPESE